MTLTAAFLQNSNFIGDHPDAVARLRRLVVTLAIGGKLGGLGADCFNLFEQLNAKRQASVESGKPLKAPKLTPIETSDLPEVCPIGPLYVRLGDVARIVKGPTGITSAMPGPYPLVVTAADRATCDHYDFDAAAAIIPLVSSAGHGKASLQRLQYQEGRFALGSILAAVLPYAPDLIGARFLYEYLVTFKDELLVSQMIGTANVSLNVGKVASVPVPIVPPDVQSTVAELMALCDRLEAARAEREAARDRLTEASLARLSTPDPETFHADARFALNALPVITTASVQVKLVRQAILNLAVQGKLVKQTLGDEPAAAQLDRVFQEKGALTRRKRRLIGRPDAVPRVENEGDLPHGWAWASLGDLAMDLRFGTSKKCTRAAGGVPVLRIPNVSRGELSLVDLKFGPLTVAEQSELGLQVGDLLVIRSNGSLRIVGRAAEVTREAEGMSFAGYLVRVRLSPKEVVPRYVWLCLNSDEVRKQIEGPIRSAVGLMNINSAEISAIRFRLPPFGEQQRIVKKIDQLFALCDRLEKELSAGELHRCNLLEALLLKAVAPAEALEEVA